jgi:hypothetical protein
VQNSHDPNTGEWICPPISNALSIAGLYLYMNILKEDENICYLGLLKVIYFNRANNLEVVLTHHDVFTFSSQRTIDEIT